MNCRFCGNFVPDGADSCPVCGRRPEEEPIGKLLSDNQPNSGNNEVKAIEPKNELGSKPQSLVPPLVAIALCVAGWLYGLSQKVIESFKTVYSILFEGGASVGANSDFVANGMTQGDRLTMIIIVAAVLILTVIGIVGLISLFKRLINNFKYNKN